MNEKVREALEPFAKLALPFMKQSERDESVWTRLSDDTRLLLGGADFTWNYLTVGDLRRAADVLDSLASSNVEEEEIAAILNKHLEIDNSFYSIKGIDEAARAILSLLSFCVKMPEWQPIETARKDGSIVLGCRDDDAYQPYSMRWDQVSGWIDPDWEVGYAPTHWMFLPTSPSPSKREG